MSKRDIARIGCKLLGIYLIVLGLNVFANVVSSYALMQEQTIAALFLSAVFPYSFLILFGILIWVLAEKLSSFMVKEETQPKEETGINANDLQRIAFSVLGLLFIGNALPEIISNGLGYFTVIQMKGDRLILLPKILASAAKLLIGLGILLGSGGLVNLLHRLRYAGTSETRGDVDDEC